MACDNVYTLSLYALMMHMFIVHSLHAPYAALSSVPDRPDLIDCYLASSHVPRLTLYLCGCVLLYGCVCLQDRDDLIDCCLASSHVPFLMDWQPAALCRGRRCVDGSMLYILTG